MMPSESELSFLCAILLRSPNDAESWQPVCLSEVGPFFLFLFFVPSLYRSFKVPNLQEHEGPHMLLGRKDFYWTQQLRKLNTEEIISDRYEWLRPSLKFCRKCRRWLTSSWF